MNTTTKKDMICGIVDIFDENERLRNELEMLKNRLGTPVKSISTPMDARIYDYGFKEMLKNCFSSWMPNLSVEFDGAKYSPNMGYDYWFNKYLNEVPSNFSKLEFNELVRDEMTKVYNDELAKAKQKAKKKYDDDMEEN